MENIPSSSTPADIVVSPPVITTSYSGFPLKTTTTSTTITTKTETTVSLQPTLSVPGIGGFPRFLVLQDAPVDHHYIKEKTSAAGEVAECISRQWHRLDADLPDSVSVRVYRSRPDLLRAAVCGGVNTPYHNFVYVFDIFLPPGFPISPPKVHTVFPGFMVGPNLFRDGRVRLNVLNTWTGNTWKKNQTGLLEVLVVIQNLFRDASPYFQEPCLVRRRGSPSWKSVADRYSEKVYLKSCYMTLRLLADPPADFREIVIPHFGERAVDILADLRRYSLASVGAMVEICGGLVLRVTRRFKADAQRLYGRMLESMFTRYRGLIHQIIYDQARVALVV